jgi:hypothetical protein
MDAHRIDRAGMNQPLRREMGRGRTNPFQVVSLKAIDERFKVPEEMLTEMNNRFTDAEINKLTGHLKGFLLAGQEVEKKLSSDWNIPPVAKSITIPYCRWWQPYNQGQAVKDGMLLRVGNPDEHNSFFANPRSLYAHENGHILSFFQPDGSLHDELCNGYNIGPLRKLLAVDGQLKLKFLQDIPFNILPEKLLFVRDWSLLSTANELIADKVAMQVCGREEWGAWLKTRIPAQMKLFEGAGARNDILRFIVYVREFGLKTEEQLFRQALASCDVDTSWTLKDAFFDDMVSSTEQTLDRLTDFFHQVSLKKQ